MTEFMKTLISCLAALAVTSIGVALWSKEVVGQRPGDAATPGTVMQRDATEKQREYSKVLRRMSGEKQRRFTFTEMIEKAERLGRANEEIGILGLEPETYEDPDGPPVTVAKHIQTQSCNADTIVVGTVKSRTSVMTDDEQYAYTEYPLAIDEVLKNVSPLSLKPAQAIEVVRPGGVIQFNGHRIKVLDRTYPYLDTNRTYLLFLKFVPETNGFIATRSGGDLEILNNSYKALGGVQGPKQFNYGTDFAGFLREQRTNFIATACQGADE